MITIDLHKPSYLKIVGVIIVLAIGSNIGKYILAAKIASSVIRRVTF